MLREINSYLNKFIYGAGADAALVLGGGVTGAAPPLRGVPEDAVAAAGRGETSPLLF
jgi:hypothetical protein